MGSNIKVYISKVDINSKGALILLTRKHYGFIKRLFELEIPEISDGTVLIYSVARDAGNRTKIAVYSEVSNVDPIGACIGERGTRIANILKELGGEKLDIVNYERDLTIENIEAAAKLCSECIQNGGVVQVFGSGHSIGFGMEMRNRIGDLVPIHQIDMSDFVIKGKVTLADFKDQNNILYEIMNEPNTIPIISGLTY